MVSCAALIRHVVNRKKCLKFRELFLHLIAHKGIHSVELLWKRDRPVAETSTWKRTFTEDIRPCNQNDSNLQSQQTCGLRPHAFDCADTSRIFLNINFLCLCLIHIVEKKCAYVLAREPERKRPPGEQE